jgi:hypothetical protein
MTEAKAKSLKGSQVRKPTDSRNKDSSRMTSNLLKLPGQDAISRGGSSARNTAMSSAANSRSFQNISSGKSINYGRTNGSQLSGRSEASYGFISNANLRKGGGSTLKQKTSSGVKHAQNLSIDSNGTVVVSTRAGITELDGTGRIVLAQSIEQSEDGSQRLVRHDRENFTPELSNFMIESANNRTASQIGNIQA